jgi:hypothetical protein
VDQELKQHLEAMESRIVRLVTEVKESLERQSNTGFENVASRLDAQATRLDRQAALLQVGSRWTNRMIAWSEKVDVALEKRAQEIGELRSRFEKRKGGAK